MCYKKKEVGQLPSRCPKGFFFDTTLESCVETCLQDYTYHLASCWTTCPTGTQDCGGFCGSSCTESSSWKAKKNYVPSHIPSTNNDVKCEKGLYKSCNLCFKDCKKIGLLNCDAHTCASSLASCKDKDHTVSNKYIRAVLSLMSKIFKLGSKEKNIKSPAVKKNKKSFLPKLSHFLSTRDSLKKQIYDTFKRIESSKSAYDDFLNRVMDRAIKDMPSHGYYIRNIAKAVSEKWIRSVVKGETSNNYKQKLGLREIGNFQYCDSKIEGQENCALSIFKLVEHLGPLEFPTLFSQFKSPFCDL
jgi:hypothetical protein